MEPYTGKSRQYIKYILLESNDLPKDIKANKVTLKRSLATDPQTDLTIEVYNIMFNNRDLAVFSVMPSLFSNNPAWQKINIDIIKSTILNLTKLHEQMESRFMHYPQKDHGWLDRLKYHDYVLIIKRPDGYYCNTTDCFTEFFTVINKPGAIRSTGFQLNLGAKMLSIGEYESDYKRRNSSYSNNCGISEFSYNPDLKDGFPRLNLSFVTVAIGQNPEV